MSKTVLVDRFCETCGATTCWQPYECDGCGVVAEVQTDGRAFSDTPLPPGWLTFAETVADRHFAHTTTFCSWACVQGHAEAKQLARG